jgi:cytochrome c oxidase assembly factor CtaG
MLDPSNWAADPALAWVFCAAALYWLGGRHVKRRPPTAADRWRTASFVVGLATIVVALSSPIHGLSGELLWVHMVQHILLVLVAPPLLALAQPWNRIWHGLPLAYRRTTARWVVQSPRLAPLRRAAHFLADPLPAWLLFNATFVAWHLPVAYDAALHSSALHALEHVTFFATGLLFWTRVIDSPPWRSALGDVGRAVYVGLALVVSWVLAIVLALATSPLYAPYADLASRPGGISALADQHLAAGMMWVPGSIPFTIVIVLLAYRWLQPRGSASALPDSRPLAASPLSSRRR